MTSMWVIPSQGRPGTNQPARLILNGRAGGHPLSGLAPIGLDGTILAGHLPRRAARLVLEWAGLHEVELAECWERAVNHEPPGTIEPLS